MQYKTTAEKEEHDEDDNVVDINDVHFVTPEDAKKGCELRLCDDLQPRQVSNDVLPPWDAQRYRFERVIMPAPQSGGQVELHLDRMTGQTVAVKRFPHVWLRDSPQAYNEAYPETLENPWQELEVSQSFGRPGAEHLAGVCFFHGAFRCANGDAVLASEYLPGGDLFELASNLGPPGPQRERQAWPMVMSLLDTVLALHKRGVAHGDVSLENIMLRRVPNSNAKQVVLVDFGMTVSGNLSKATGTRGKPSYQAPEMFLQECYDARSADLFACGVVAYALAVGSYPWNSTRPGRCFAFDYAQKFGLEAFLQRRKISTGDNSNIKVPVGTILSSEYTRVMLRLLDFNPSRRQVLVPNLSTLLQVPAPHGRRCGRRPHEKPAAHHRPSQVMCEG
jgi:serine/threonine protein kinase